MGGATNRTLAAVLHKQYCAAYLDIVIVSHCKVQYLVPIHWTDELQLMSGSTSTQGRKY